MKNRKKKISYRAWNECTHTGSWVHIDRERVCKMHKTCGSDTAMSFECRLQLGSSLARCNTLLGMCIECVLSYFSYSLLLFSRLTNGSRFTFFYRFICLFFFFCFAAFICLIPQYMAHQQGIYWRFTLHENYSTYIRYIIIQRRSTLFLSLDYPSKLTRRKTK